MAYRYCGNQAAQHKVIKMAAKTKTEKLTVATLGQVAFYEAKYFAKGRLCGGEHAAWPIAAAGDQPTAEMLAVCHAINRKNPGAEALHIAMCFRPQGCTVAQLEAAGNCGPANNYRNKLVGVAKVISVAKLASAGRAYAFHATLTASGAALVKAALGYVPDFGGKPARKPRAPKVAKAKPVGTIGDLSGAAYNSAKQALKVDAGTA